MTEIFEWGRKILDPFTPQRIAFVGFNFDDYPRLCLGEIAKASKKAKKSAEATKSGRRRRSIEGETHVYNLVSGHGDKYKEAVGTGEILHRPRVPSYGIDDLFKEINVPLRPRLKAPTVQKHWGNSVWPSGGF